MQNQTFIEAELLRVEPNAERFQLGSHDIYRFQTVTPAHTYSSIIKSKDSGSLIQLTARDSFDERLAVHLLDQVDELELGDRADNWVRVHPTAFPDPWKFEVIVVVPPPVASRFRHQSEILSSLTFWILPAVSGEFKDGDNSETFQHQLGRKDGWRIHPINWSRKLKTEPNWD